MKDEERKRELRRIRTQLLAFCTGEDNDIPNLVDAVMAVDGIQLVLARDKDYGYPSPAWSASQRAATAGWDFARKLEELDNALGVMLAEKVTPKKAKPVEEGVGQRSFLPSEEETEEELPTKVPWV